MNGHNKSGNKHRHKKDRDHHYHALQGNHHPESHDVEGRMSREGDFHASSDIADRHEEAAVESHVDGGSYGADVMQRSGGGSVIPGGMAAFNEEIGADFAYGMPVTGKDEGVRKHSSAVEEDRSASGSAVGWVALVFAIASWLIWPMLMGITSVVLGFIAYRQGAKGLGGWSIALGLVAIVIRMIAAPLFGM
jgi:hypothetical protein